MSEAVLVAIISGALTLIGTVVTVVSTSRKQGRSFSEAFAVHQAVTNEKIDTLTREVQRHNGFAERIPVLEERVDAIKERLDGMDKK